MLAIQMQQHGFLQTFRIHLQQLSINNGDILAHLLGAEPDVQQLRVAALVQ